MHRIAFNAPEISSGIEVTLPASKSISNRLLLLQYIRPDIPEIINLSNSADTKILRKVLQDIRAGATVINIEDCGTAMRFLVAALAATPGKFILQGTVRMHERPIRDLVDGLSQIGADIQYLGEDGFPPLLIQGKKLPGGQMIMDGSVSSQFVSALMMASVLMENKLEIFLHTGLASIPYIQMTGELMLQCGIPAGTFDIYMSDSLIQQHGIETIIPDKKYIVSEQISVESDWSAASYIYGALACSGLKEIYIPSLNTESVQGDSLVATLFHSLGVETFETSGGVQLVHSGKTANHFEFNGLHHPDLIPTLAVVTALLGIPAVFSGLDNLIHKETNRLQALFEEINALFPGACLIEGATLKINSSGITPQKNHVVDTRGDHRMAMAFALCAAHFPIRLSDISVVKKSFPAFWDELKKLGFEAIPGD